MANIVPKGVDTSTGQHRPVTSADVRVDEAGNLLDVPTPGKWGANNQTFSAADTAASITTTVDLTGGIDLLFLEWVQIQIDDFPVHTDLDIATGAVNINAVTRTEIINKLNTAFGTEATAAAVAGGGGEEFISITSSTLGANSKIEFTAPSNFDGTDTAFGTAYGATSTYPNTFTGTWSAALTLTDTSPALQFLDTSSIERTVILPPAATTNPVFTIINTGLKRLSILNSGGNTVGLVDVSGKATCYSDGTDWHVLGGFDRLDLPLQIYNYGGRVNTDNDYTFANGQFDDVPGTGDTQSSNFHTVTDDGVLAFVSWRSQNVLEAIVFSIYVNQVQVAHTEPMIGASGIVKIAKGASVSSGFGDIAISAGDELSIRHNTTGQVDPIDMSLNIGVYAPGGHTYTFGGSVAAGGYYPTNEIASSTIGTPGLDESTEHTIAVAGTIHAIGYRTSSGTATSQLQLYINGTGQGAFNLDASGVGVETVSIPVTAGQTIAFEHVITAQDNGDATISVALSNTPGQLYFFGANINTNNAYYVVNGANIASNNTSLNESNQATMMRPGTLTVSWRSDGAGTGAYSLWKNGASVETFGDLSTTSGTASLTTTVLPGDQIGISAADATIGTTSLVIAVEL